MRDPRPEGAGERMLSADVIRRLCAGLILTEQAELVRQGKMPPGALLPLQDPHLSPMARDALRIDEDCLGFDSLARLGLILRVNRFFSLSDTGIEDYLLLHRTLGDWVGLIGQHLDMVADRARWTFSTSGSAGPVKHIAHHTAVLMAEIRAQRRGPLAHVAPGGRVISLVPPQHIYGFLFTCLLPPLLQAQVLDLHLAGPGAAVRCARPGDLIIGTPFTWEMMGKTGQALPQGVFGVTSAGPSTAATWAVRQINGLARLTEVCGATETGGIGSRDDPLQPFRLLPHLTQHDGQIIDPLRNPSALQLQDQLTWLDADQFHVMGRIDDVVQVGGVNVSPGEITAVLCACEGVAAAAVRPGSDRMKAFVVPDQTFEGLDTLEARLRAHILRNLPAPARPVSVTFGTALPRNAMGKLCDWEVAAHCG